VRCTFNAFAHSFYLDHDPDIAKSVFICGAGRSGTTWLAEILNRSGSFRYLYEPFNRGQVRQCRHFSARQYMRPSDHRTEYLGVAEAIFSGKIRSGWIDQYNSWGLTRYRLIKDVRSTLMLKWIRDHFPQMPIVFVVRHPCAVAFSRCKEGWRTDLRDAFTLKIS
jgi:hypothetical protein